MPLKTINIEGQVYFVTSKIYRNLNIFVYDRFCETVINTLEFMKKQNKFKLLGYIIMPDHLHLVIWPMGKNTISDIMRDFKKYTSRQIINYAIKSEKCGSPDPHSLVRLDREIQPSQIKNYKCDQEKRPSPENKLNYPTFSELLKIFTVNTKKQYYKLWQSHNWIENIYSEKFLGQKLDYIHNNPVRAGLLKKTEDFKYSSSRNYYLKDNSLIKIDKIQL